MSADVLGALSLRERRELSDQIRRSRDAIAALITEDFFARHPDWLARYGERGRAHGRLDGVFHLDFLAGAIDAGSLDAFRDYVRWTTRMLGARSIGAEFIAESLRDIGVRLEPTLVAAGRPVVAAVLAAGISACGDAPTPAVADAAPNVLAQARALFLTAILGGNRRAAVGIATESLTLGYPVTEVYVELFQESMFHVGRLWESNQITVAEEHMATAITQFVLAQCYAHVPQPTRRLGRVVITGVSGELHQLGGLMVSDVLEAEGYDVRFLGTNLPHAGIAEAVREHRADVLGISVTMLFNIPAAIELLAEVRAAVGDRMPRIVVGGAAFRASPELAREIGAEGVGYDVRSAATLLS